MNCLALELPDADSDRWLETGAIQGGFNSSDEEEKLDISAKHFISAVSGKKQTPTPARNGKVTTRTRSTAKPGKASGSGLWSDYTKLEFVT